VQASLTGHLVLSTVHTNDAAGAITRMRDMRVEPVLLASTLRAVIAQRWCGGCAPSLPAPGARAATRSRRCWALAASASGEPVGCDQVRTTGYQGPVGVFEAIRVDETVAPPDQRGGDEAAIAAHAFARGDTLADAARRLVERVRRRRKRPCGQPPRLTGVEGPSPGGAGRRRAGDSRGGA
jgi:general secretion pathway protein E